MDPEKNITPAIEAGKAIVPHQVVFGTSADRRIGFLHHKDLAFVEVNERNHYGNPAVPRRCDIVVHAVPDFAEAVKRFGDNVKTLTIWANSKNRTLQAILNDDDDLPGWRDRTITMTVEKSRELAAWEPFFADWRKQTEFAEFLEEHADEVEEGATLLEMAQELIVTREAACKSAVRLQTGGTRLQFSDDTNAEVEVPKEITLKIPLFSGGPVYKLSAFLRFRLREGGVSFLVKPKLLDRAKEEGFAEIVEAARPLVPVPIIRVA